eukprot:scaffold197238_cov26-Attheya_sp.AAC.2
MFFKAQQERQAAKEKAEHDARKAKAQAQKKARRDAFIYISSDASSGSDTDSDESMPEKDKSTFSKQEDDRENSSASQTTEPQRESQGTFMSKEDTMNTLQEIHLQLRFQDWEHMFMLPPMWLSAQKRFPFKEVRDEITDLFLSAILTSVEFFVEDDFKDWNPKIHGPRNFLQSFYIAALAYDAGSLKDYPMANKRKGVLQETRSSTNPNEGMDMEYESESSVSSAASSSRSNHDANSKATSEKKNNRREQFALPLKKYCKWLKLKDDELFTRDKKRPQAGIALMPLQKVLDPILDRLSLLNLEDELEREDLPDNFRFFEIAYCGHTSCGYARVQKEQAIELLQGHFTETDHEYIEECLFHKKTQMVCMYFVYRAKKNELFSSITALDQKAYSMDPTYGESEVFR